MAKTAANETVNDAQKIVDVWTANPAFSMGEVTLKVFEAAMKTVSDADAAVEAKRRELTGLADVRDDAIKHLQELTTRARSGVRSTFGPLQGIRAGRGNAQERAQEAHAQAAS